MSADKDTVNTETARAGGGAGETNCQAAARDTAKLTDWFPMGKGARQGCVLSPCLFNLYAEDIMRNAGLEEAQAGINIAGRNINNLRYADDTTLMQKVKSN